MGDKNPAVVAGELSEEMLSEWMPNGFRRARTLNVCLALTLLVKEIVGTILLDWSSERTATHTISTHDGECLSGIFRLVFPLTLFQPFSKHRHSRTALGFHAPDQA